MRRMNFAFLVILTLAEASVKYKIPKEEMEKGNSYWYSLGEQELDDALHRDLVEKKAKNVIIFLGDGMGVTVSTAGRIYKGQTRGSAGEEGYLSWERFPSVALSKTYNLDKQVPDSAATATAFFSGVKGNFYTLGVNGDVAMGDCKASLKSENRPESILKWSQEAGKDTGFITTTRITHATPAALYAHSSHRYWECDKKMSESQNDTDGCKDIAQQLVEDLPGRDVNVIFAGGRNQMGAPLPTDIKKSFCLRNDGRNLVEEWVADKQEKRRSVRYVKSNQEFREMDIENIDHVMGLFAGDHLPYSYMKEDVPSLKDLTTAAIRRLRRNPEGFFLMVEGGRIDHALHDSKPHRALDELLAFDEAVEAAREMTDDEDTLVVVTADHSHVMTFNGYPDRGNDILGTTNYKYVADGLEYTTLMFTNGNGANFTWDGGKVVRANVTGIDTRDYDFMPQAAVPMKDGYETHGGEDVTIYASGPMSHLFHRLHEQSYIAHVMGYASCVGPYQNKCHMKEAQPIYEFSSANRKDLAAGSILVSLLLSSLYLNFLML